MGEEKIELENSVCGSVEAAPAGVGGKALNVHSTAARCGGGERRRRKYKN